MKESIFCRSWTQAELENWTVWVTSFELEFLLEARTNHHVSL